MSKFYSNNPVRNAGFFTTHAPATDLALSERHWIGGAAGNTTNWNTSLNWSLTSGGAGLASGGVPTYQNDVFFDSNSNSYNCSMPADGICNTITFSNTYNKTFNMNGHGLMSNGSMIFDGTTGSQVTLSALMIMGDGDFSILGVDTINFLSFSLDIQGTGSVTLNKNTVRLPGNVKWAYPGKTTTWTYGGAAKSFANACGISGGVMTNNGGTLLFNTAFYLGVIASTAPIVNNGGVFGGTSSLYIDYQNSGTLTSSLPALNVGGSVPVQITRQATADLTINMAGAINCGNLSVINYMGSTAGAFVFASNDYAITGLVLALGSSVSTSGSNSFNFGNSILSITAFDSSTYNTGASTVAQATSQWTCSGNWTIGSNTTTSGTTSSVNFIGAGNSLITSAGKTMYGIYVNKSASSYIVRQLDTLNCNSISAVTGAWDANGYDIISADDVLFTDVTANYTTVNVTITGDGDFWFPATSGTVTTTGSIDVRGNGNIYMNECGVRWVNITLAYSGHVTRYSGIPCDTTGWTGVLTINGGNFIVAKNLYGFPTASGSPIVIVGGSTITGTGILGIQANNTTSEVYTLPAITVPVSFVLYKINTGDVTFTFTGALNCTTSSIVLNRNATGTMTTNFYASDTNVYGDLIIGSDTANTTSYINLAGLSGSSCNNYISTSASGSVNNISLSTMSCAINWTNSATDVVTNAGAALITFSTLINSTITCNGVTTGSIVLSKNNTYTLNVVGTLYCAGILTSSGAKGNFDCSASDIISTGTITFQSTGTLKVGNITVTGNNHFYLLTTVGTLTINSGTALDLQGTGNLSLSKANTTWDYIKLGYTGNTTTWTASTGTTSGSNITTTVNGGLFQLTGNGVYNVFAFITGQPLVIVGSGSIDLHGVSTAFDIKSMNTAGTIVVTIPAITCVDNGGSTGSFQLFKNAAGNVEFDLGGAAVIPYLNVASLDNTGSSTIAFDTKGYALTCTGGINDGANSSVTGSTKFNGSTIAVGYFNTNGAYNNTQSLDYGSSVWSVSGTTFNIGSNSTITPGTSSITIMGDCTININNGQNFRTLILDANGHTITWATATAVTIYRFQIKPGTTNKFLSSASYTITTYVAGDWDGTSGNRTVLKSTTDTSPHTLINPVGMTVNYINTRDSTATNDITAKHSLDGTGNTHWIITNIVIALIMFPFSVLEAVNDL